jgi:hypothetical protein
LVTSEHRLLNEIKRAHPSFLYNRMPCKIWSEFNNRDLIEMILKIEDKIIAAKQ